MSAGLMRLEITSQEGEMLRLVEEAISTYAECGEDFPEGLSDYKAEYNPDFPDEVTLIIDGQPRWRLRLERVS